MPDRRRSSLLAILALLAVFAAGLWVAGGLLLEGDVPLFPREGRVAVVPVRGVIESEQRLLRWLDRVREDGSVEAFVVEVRSPGGTVGATQSLYRAVRELRDEDERPVVAWIGDVGASGGYYVALGADSIFALPGSITGSIGVIMQFPDASGLLKKTGVEFQVVKSGELKDAGSPLRPLSEDDRKVFQALVDDTYRQFVEAVAENRSIQPERARELADGRVFSGERAASLGLVDGTATLDEAVDRAARLAGLGEDPPLVRPTDRRPGLLDLVREVLRSAAGPIPALAGAKDLRAPRLLYQWR